MIPRPEHPKPQFCRESWMNLNGQWSFEVDNVKSGVDRGMQKVDATFSQTITVPFCPESKLSGIGTHYEEHRLYAGRMVSEEGDIDFPAVQRPCISALWRSGLPLHGLCKRQKGGFPQGWLCVL